jgi:hypothetical protein
MELTPLVLLLPDPPVLIVMFSLGPLSSQSWTMIVPLIVVVEVPDASRPASGAYTDPVRLIVPPENLAKCWLSVVSASRTMLAYDPVVGALRFSVPPEKVQPPFPVKTNVTPPAPLSTVQPENATLPSK